MIRVRQGKITKIIERSHGITRVLVDTGEPETDMAPALGYDRLVGPLAVDDRVALNTTAVHKGLGTGGQHFVICNIDGPGLDPVEPGHIMKLRYTPCQVKVLAVEEEEHPGNAVFRETLSLQGIPVVVGSLHSMLAPAAAALVHATGGFARVVYLMTDGAALPISMSHTVAWLKENNFIAGTVTCGHAFGGDLEAINIYSGLLAARGVLGADVIVAAMGPGIVGSGTNYGFTGVEQGELVNAVNILGGRAVAIPRISFADGRERHRGLSHHTCTALGRIALTPAVVTMPGVEGEKKELLMQQFRESGLDKLHSTLFVDVSGIKDNFSAGELPLSTMGRGFEKDPEFFLAAGAAGLYAGDLIHDERSLY